MKFWDLVLTSYTSMDTNLPLPKHLMKDFFVVKDFNTQEIVGLYDKLGSSFFVLKTDTVISTWMKKYNALANYDMGIVVELCNKQTIVVEHFSTFHAFVQPAVRNEVDYTQYFVQQVPLTNLELVAIKHAHNEYLEKQQNRTIDD